MLDGMKNGKMMFFSWGGGIGFLCIINVSNAWEKFLSLFNFIRWEKYDAKGWTEKGAHKYGRLNEQSWWEKWGEHYDGRGSVLKWFVF